MPTTRKNTTATDDAFDDWEEVELPTGNFAKFDTEGTAYQGVIEMYDPNTGATTYDGDPCGFVQLVDADGESIIVSLDKPALRDRVVAAAPKVGDVIRIEHDGSQKSKRTGRVYKSFSVRIKRQRS